MEQQIRFCTSADGTQLAYAAYCDGDALPVVRVSSWIVTEELNWDDLGFREITEGLAPGGCLYSYDRRGIGASQRNVEDVSLEAQVEDLAAIVDHAGLDRCHLAGWLDGTAVCIAYAAQYPKRVARLALQMPMTRGDDSWPPETIRSLIELVGSNWPLARRSLADLYHPYGSAEHRRTLKDGLEQGVSAEIAAKYLTLVSSYDISSYMPNVQAPTLVLADRSQGARSVASISAVAARIPRAQLIKKEAAGLNPKATPRTVTELMREFLYDASPADAAAMDTSSRLTVILFADIANSTGLTEELGDAAFREKARALDIALRDAISRAGGTAIEGKLLGDGVLATFNAAREAIACAQACHEVGSSVDLKLHVGIHAGDVIREDAPDGRANVFGGAVNVAARISDASEPGETLVSGTVRELARTSAGVSFEDRGERKLKGVSDAVRVFAVR